MNPEPDSDAERRAIRTAVFDWLQCKQIEAALEEPFEEGDEAG